MNKHFTLIAALGIAFFIQNCQNTPKTADAAPAAPVETETDKSAKPDPNDLLAALQGRWRSESDSTVEIEIADTQMRYYNGGKFSHQSMIDVDGSCESPVCKPGDTDISDGWCFTESMINEGKYAAISNFVSRCDAEALQYRPLAGQKPLLTYKKIH